MIFVIGGTGFVGRFVVRNLLQLGQEVLVASRSTPPNPLRIPGVSYVRINILDTDTLTRNLQKARVVINLVGIIRPTKQQSFQQAHVESVSSLVEAMKRTGVRRLIHMSALGTRPHAPSMYHQTKWQGEQIVRSSGLDWTILRPGLIIGPGDRFVGTFAKMMRPPLSLLQLGTIPLFGQGQMTFQPVGVEEVAKCFTRVISRPDSVGETFEICGREVITLRRMIEEIAHALGKNPSYINCNPELIPFIVPVAALFKNKPLLFDVPMPVAKLLGWLLENILPSPPLTYDQAIMLEEGSRGDPSRAEAVLGLKTYPFKELISYLRNA